MGGGAEEEEEEEEEEAVEATDVNVEGAVEGYEGVSVVLVADEFTCLST